MSANTGNAAEPERGTVENAGVQARQSESEERFRSFVVASSDVVYRMNPDWSRMERLDGRGFLADTAMPTETWMDRYIQREDRAMVQEAIDQAIRTKLMFELEHRVRRADGTLGWTLSRAVPILDEREDIAEWIGAAKDVTARRMAEDALRAEKSD